MLDKFNREINYARISITDACNLRCLYCMPNGYIAKYYNFLTVEEIKNIVTALSHLGVKRIRVTGGEPLVRQDILDIIRTINEVDGIEDIGITTNGILLGDKIFDLVEYGLKRVNISLDSLKEDRFKKLTGGDLKRVLDGLNKALEHGLVVKVNMIPIKGINDDEIVDFIEMTKHLNIDVRFIELMPIGEATRFTGVTKDDIMKYLEGANIVKIENNGGGPSEVYRLDGHSGRVGFITTMSHSFCSRCNRVRITSDGKLKTCLHNPDEYDLRPYIDDVDRLLEVLKMGIYNKYERHTLLEDKISKSSRDMVRTGG
ncbi:MAG: molybdenum cofactor biosynthesis protein [Caloramator sp.]|jgi:cyclic pyranopterin phosphate synthase|uniref:GTP 3',8-cyclase MoaA n=1 Tax=Caloramator sp. TaxID=1871330 RepID=UPI001D8B6C53|nr:GTP 3',8-cyclase MoaA [Caloramator sp.]MBZ4662841.1 molybdenum cofactor biosynthesis protein [Caloramator sp.]